MKLLLTSGGVTNTSIRDALVDLLGKPIDDSTALCIPTAQWGHPMCGPTSVRGFVSGLPPWGSVTSLDWMRASGLADLLPSLPDTTWVGVSAGSMVMTPRIGDLFVEWPSAPDDRTLGLVDFSIFPHLDVFPTNTMEAAERWAAGIDGPVYVIDDETAIRVVDGNQVDVVSEGTWKLLNA